MKNGNRKNFKNQAETIVQKPQSRPAPKKTRGKVAGWISFFKEVRVELKKVTWPPRREIISSTMALIVATLLIGLFLGVVDMILAKGIAPALAGNAGIMTVATLVMFIGILVWVYKSN
ncbi:preprotein translocase subunit SecE [bacterium]|nr:preprotein translocase subunit SecE [candidate division CSSED10-310 bacterium]